MITTTQVVARFTTDGATVEYAYPNNVIDAGDLHLTLDGEVFSDFTAVKDDPQPGATVTLGSAPASGGLLVITRRTPWTQLIDFTPGEALNAETLETGLDKLTLILQEMADQCGTVLAPLQAPSDFTATDGATGSQAQLAWTANSTDHDWWELHRRQAGQVFGTLFGQVSAGLTALNDNTVSPGDWEYRLRAFRAGTTPGEPWIVSPWTEIAEVTVT